jgi:transposase
MDDFSKSTSALHQPSRSLGWPPGPSSAGGDLKNLSAQVIVSEIGTDMSRFPSDQHLISWAGICPRNDESVGKRRSNRLRNGAPWLKTTLVQCAWAAKHKKDSYLQAQFYRIKARRGSASEGRMLFQLQRLLATPNLR